MLPDRIASTFQTAAQGLALQRERISVASQNIANAQTSAPPGARNVYSPKTVQTQAPGQRKFVEVLGESLSNIKQTNPRHLSTSNGSLNSNAIQKQTGLGPEFSVQNTESYRFEFDPDHPDADENGMVRYPDVDLVREMAEMVSANRLYEANLSSIQAEKEIIKRAFEI